MTERKQGHSKLVYDKASRTIKTVDPHPAALAATPAVDDMDYVSPPGKNPRTFYVSATPAVGVDYVLMPREATRAMTMAACDSLPSCEHVFGHAGEMLRNCYRKMVGVAAQPASPLRGREATIEECAKIVDDFMWTLPLYAPTENINVATGESACIVIRQVAEAIRALSAAPPEQPAADSWMQQEWDEMSKGADIDAQAAADHSVEQRAHLHDAERIPDSST